VVVEGAVSVNLIDGLREKVLYTVEPGQLCVHTLTNLINDREYQATAIAQKDTQVGWMDATSFRFMRQDHGVTHTLGLASTGDWLIPLLLVVSAQLFVIVFGAIAMQTHAYLPRVWRGEVQNVPVFSLICPGVALSVSLQFLINKGFVAAGVVTKFSATYWILSAMPVVLAVMTISVFLRLMHGFLKERDKLFNHGNAVEAR
jgi:hypothetical protein